MKDYLLLIVNRQAKDCDGIQTSGNCTLRHYEKDGVKFSVLWEYNSSYGELCRQWIIDGNMQSNIPSKYFEGHFLAFDASEGRCGERLPERESLNFEFLCKPLDLPWIDKRNKQGCRLHAGPSVQGLKPYQTETAHNWEK
jgi:hypothetical protein